MSGGDMVIDIQSPDVDEDQQLAPGYKPETVCDTTSDNVGFVTSPMTTVKTECDVIGIATTGNGRVGGVPRRPGKMATNSTSGKRRSGASAGSVRIEERRFRCAECFKAFKFKHHLQVCVNH